MTKTVHGGLWITAKPFTDCKVNSGCAKRQHCLTRFNDPHADGTGSVQRVELQPNFDPENSAGFRNYLGWPAMLDGVDCLVGELLRVRATLVGLDGTTMTSERDILVMAGADPPPMCAQ